MRMGWMYGITSSLGWVWGDMWEGKGRHATVIMWCVLCAKVTQWPELAWLFSGWRHQKKKPFSSWHCRSESTISIVQGWKPRVSTKWVGRFLLYAELLDLEKCSYSSSGSSFFWCTSHPWHLPLSNLFYASRHRHFFFQSWHRCGWLVPGQDSAIGRCLSLSRYFFLPIHREHLLFFRV